MRDSAAVRLTFVWLAGVGLCWGQSALERAAEEFRVQTREMGLRAEGGKLKAATPMPC